MHTNRISPARKILFWLGALAVLALLAGCETVTLTNLTPPSMAENPSQIYTFSLRVTPRTRTVPASSIAPNIIVDGQVHPMKRSAMGEGIYDYEYTLPPGRQDVSYYFLVNYSVEGNGVLTPREAYTDLATVKIVNRYVLSLEVTRGPVGARISLLGRGFTPTDTIAFNGQPVRTEFESPTSLSFFVPGLEANRNYNVTLSNSAGNSPVGSFRIDPSTITVYPLSLALQTGGRQQLSFTVQHPAPVGGTLIDVTTDVPESVIMPEIVIPQGSTTTTVTVEGGKPGTGSLFLKGYGSGEVTIPVTVAPR